MSTFVLRRWHVSTSRVLSPSLRGPSLCLQRIRVATLTAASTVRETRVATPIAFQLHSGRQGAFSISAPSCIRKQYSNGSGVPPNQHENFQPAKDKQLSKQASEIRLKLRQSLSTNVRHENIYTLPNILTFSRLAATPFIGYFILYDAHVWAVSLLFYAGATDLVDGWIARRWNQQTVVGTVVDPLADKALMTILTVCLAVKGALPIWLATLILGRDVSLAIAAIYYRFASLPPPKTLARYWNFSLPSAEVHPTGVSKANTVLQLLLVGATTALPVAGPTVDAFLKGLTHGDIGISTAMAAAQYLVAATTVWSGCSYLFTRKAVKILGEASEAEKTKILVKGRVIIGACFASCFALAMGLEQLYA